MRFVGNKVESDAKRHKDHRYTHTDEREVNYYDCFAHDHS
jgi:hypothetical protein